MLEIKNKTLKIFMGELIGELKRENYDREYYNKYREEKESILDIPFIISSLYQSFSNNENKYKEFISDLEKFDDYYLVIKKPNPDDYDEILSIEIYSYKDIDYEYELHFYLDERMYGYCECTPDMPDYREDKKCCGNKGCDACFCEFELNKVIKIVSDDWHGNERDYWEFEDAFYKNEKELLEKKEKERKALQIEELRKSIDSDTRKLAELLSDGDN